MPKKARLLCHLRIGGSASSSFGALLKFSIAGCEPWNRIGVPYFVLSSLGCWRSHGVRVDAACAVVCDDECLASMSVVRPCVPGDVRCNVNVFGFIFTMSTSCHM